MTPGAENLRTMRTLKRIAVALCIVSVPLTAALWWYILAATGPTPRIIFAMVAMVGGLALSWVRTFEILREHQR